jgi:hypothetical protein
VRSGATGLIGRAGGIWILGVVGCSATEPVIFNFSDPIWSGLTVITTVDGDDRPIRVSAPFLLESGVLVDGQPPSWTLEPNEVAAVAAVIPIVDLRRSLPGLQVPVAQVVVTEGPPGPGSAPPNANSTWTTAPVPLSSSALRLAPGGTAQPLPEPAARTFLETLALGAYADLEYCRSELPPLVAFAASEYPLADQGGRKFIRVRVVDRNRLLVAAHAGLYLLHRDQPFVPTGQGSDPRNLIETTSLDPTSRAEIQGVAIADPGEVEPRVWVVVGVDPRPEAPVVPPSSVHLLRLTASGLVVVETSTKSAGGTLRDVAIGVDGTVAISGDDDTVLMRDPLDGRWSRTRLAAETMPLTDPHRRIVSLDDPVYSFVATTQGQIHRFHRRDRRWELQIHLLPTTDAPTFWSIAAHQGPRGKELWLGGEGLHHSDGGPFQVVQPELPPGYANCALLGRPFRFDSEISAVAILGEYLYASLLRCTAVIGLRLEDRCPFLVPPAAGGAQSAEGAYDLVQSDGALYLVTSAGRVLTTGP